MKTLASIRAKRGRKAFRFGLIAEWRVEAYLMLRGYRRIGHRLRTGKGEIDLVMVKKGVLAFIEIKARLDFDTAAFSLRKKQRERLVSAANLWLAKHRHYEARYVNRRFDLILVDRFFRLRHIQNAFYE